MRRIKALIVIGTRPEAIKTAPVIMEMYRRPESFEVCICVTGQHREMLDQVLQLFSIKPDYDLNIMKDDQSLSELTSRLLHALDRIIFRENPDWVLVQGDTTSAMVGSLVAYYHGIKIGHIEAGLRTYDKHHPFPEEINRRITGTVADFHFAPTPIARDNLVREGVADQTISVTGNTVIDSLLHVVRIFENEHLEELKEIPDSRRLILVTAHRRENFGKSLDQICSAIRTIADIYGDEVHFVYPVHLNPNIRNPVKQLLSNIRNITLLDPLPYRAFVQLMNRSYLILTDSGGIQEEAPSLNKPVLVMRNTTERPEAIEAGAAKIVGTDSGSIVKAAKNLLDNSAEYQSMANTKNPYGDGNAAEKICEALFNSNTKEVAIAC